MFCNLFYLPNGFSKNVMGPQGQIRQTQKKLRNIGKNDKCLINIYKKIKYFKSGRLSTHLDFIDLSVYLFAHIFRTFLGH